jgi:hypothetical protein
VTNTRPPAAQNNYSMEQALTTLLSKTGVHASIIEQMTKMGCTSMQVFAKLVDNRNELKVAILNQCASVKDDLAEGAKLKQAWREADAHIARGIKRANEGLSMEDLDDPLDPEVFAAVSVTFKTHYNWHDLDSRRVGSDSLHGRFKREFDRRSPSMYSFLRAKSLAKSQKDAPAKRTRLSPGMVLCNEAEEEHSVQTMANWMQCFGIVTMTWAVTGCFKVTFEGKDTLYAHWAEVEAYMFEFQERAMELRATFSESSVYNYLHTMEETMRAKAIELARGSKALPWGKALQACLKENAHLWQEKRYMLGSRQGSNYKGGGPSGGSGSLMAPDAAKGPMPESKARHCHFFSSGYCRLGEKCSYRHVCNALLANGKRCTKKHAAKEHDPEKDGKLSFKHRGKGGRGKGSRK